MRKSRDGDIGECLRGHERVIGRACRECARLRQQVSRRHRAREAVLVDREKKSAACRAAGLACWASRRRTGVGVPFLTVGVD